MNVVKRLVCVSMFVSVLLVGSLPAFSAEKVDINTASVEQLVEVKGIGEVLAQRIVEYRQAHDGFASLEELNNVKGVGGKSLKKLRPYLTLAKN